MKELKIKMAVDARRKWLPREKVMPGKPGGDDEDAHALRTNGRAVRSSVSPPLPVRETGTALPPMGASGECQEPNQYHQGNKEWLYLRQQRRSFHCCLSVWVGKFAAWCIILR